MREMGTGSRSRVHNGSFRYKLEDWQVAEIRIGWLSTRNLKDGDPEKLTYKKIQDKYKIGRNCVYKIVTNQSYLWVVVKWERGEWVWVK